MPWKSLLLIGVLLASSESLAAQTAPPAEEHKSVAESIAKIEAKARKLDANGDGWLTEDETSKGKKNLGMFYGAIKKRVDANGDGRISVDEYIQAQTAEIKAADTNSDGWITRSEANAQKRKLIGQLLMGGQ